jgi:hypothetical protein
MCANTERVKKSSTGDHKGAAIIKEFRKPDEPSYYTKMVYLKNNWKDLTKDCKTIQANWPSFGIKELPVIWN